MKSDLSNILKKESAITEKMNESERFEDVVTVIKIHRYHLSQSYRVVRSYREQRHPPHLKYRQNWYL